MTDTTELLWYRLTLLVDAARGEEAAALLWEQAAEGVEVYDSETYAEDNSIEPPPTGHTRLVSYFQVETPEHADLARQGVLQALASMSIAPGLVQFEPFTDVSWQTAWMDFFKPIAISERAVVGPPWEEFEAPTGGIKIVIEPGMAFGTGTHETTQLCAAKIDRLLADNAGAEALSLLDVGCGSAILAMIAQRLGARPVVGIDHDPTAIEVARENLKVNGFGDEIDLSTRPLAAIEQTFDIVVANILAHILIDLRDDLLARVRPGGVLLLSGITDTQVSSIQVAFAHKQFTQIDLEQKGEWVCFAYQRAGVVGAQT